jgi:hypothetical protein
VIEYTPGEPDNWTWPDDYEPVTPLVSAHCPVCGAEWKGGHEVPGKRMREGLRVFYGCGASMSFKRGDFQGVFHILLKNCQSCFPEEVKE